MNKITLVTVVLLVPFMALAAESVSITGVSLDRNTATISGTLDLGTEVSGHTFVDGNSVAPITNPSWSVSTHVNAGNHVAKATVGSVEDTLNFSVPSFDGGLAPCQIEHKCLLFGFSAPTIPRENFGLGGIKPMGNYTATGELVTISNLFDLIRQGKI